MKTKVSTEKFELSHGRRPSGRGMWVFEVESPGGEVRQVLLSGLFSDVRREVLRRHPESVRVDVMP